MSSRYFFCREKEPSKNYKNLTARITAEASRVIVLAEKLTSKYNIKVEDLELHLDASPPSGDGGTSKISDMLKGYVLGCGFSCPIWIRSDFYFLFFAPPGILGAREPPG